MGLWIEGLKFHCTIFDCQNNTQKELIMFTWRELLEKISKMTDEQLNSTVTVHAQSIDEFIPVDHFELNDSQEDDRLDDGHPFLVIFDA